MLTEDAVFLMKAASSALPGFSGLASHPAAAPVPDAYRSWDYGRGYADAVNELTKRR